MKRILIIGGLCLVILGIILIRSSRTKSAFSSGRVAISSNGTLTVQPQNDRATFTVVTAIEIGMLAFMFGVSQGLLAVYIPLLFPISIRAMATGFCFNIGRFFTAATVFFVGAMVVTFGGYGNSLFAFSFILLIGFLILLFTKKITNE